MTSELHERVLGAQTRLVHAGVPETVWQKSPRAPQSVVVYPVPSELQVERTFPSQRLEPGTQTWELHVPAVQPVGQFWTTSYPEPVELQRTTCVPWHESPGPGVQTAVGQVPPEQAEVPQS